MRINLAVGLVAVLNLALFVIFILIRHYPPGIMLVHIASLIFLWGIVLIRLKIFKLLIERWREALIFTVLVILALGVRLYKVEEVTPGMYGDEVTVARMSLDLLKNPSLPPFVSPYSHPTPLMYLTGASVKTFGHTITAIRLPSIVFDAFTVGIFFILLRLFFPLKVAILGSILMIFSYTQIVLARLAYEPPASLFFQVLSAIFLTLYWKTKDKVFLIGIALSLGAGLYTYLNFRAFAALVFLITIILILRTLRKNYLKDVGIFVGSFFAGSAALLSYIFIDPHGFWLRASEISIFSRNYPAVEFIKELGGNMLRTAAIPFIGDPNAGKNPSNMPLFDPITIVFAFIGLFYLFKKNRGLFFISLIFLLPPYLSDIFSTEVIPEFHYYGLGHPNALRVSGFIAIILFLAVWGIKWLWDQWKEEKFGIAGALIAVGIICIWNYYIYFGQRSIHPTFYGYNYLVNHQDVFDAIKHVNGSSAQVVSVTNNINALEMTKFFIKPDKKILSFNPNSSKAILGAIHKSEMTVVDITLENINYLNELTPEGLKKDGYNVKIINDPVVNQPRIALFEKIKP